MSDYSFLPRGPGWIATLVISLLSACAVVAGFHWASVHGRLPALKPAQQKAPALSGLPASAAAELLGARKLHMVVRDRVEHETLPAESIVSQEPAPQAIVAEGSSVAVVVSSGARVRLTVPEVVGQTRKQAEAALTKLGLTVAASEAAAPDAVVEATEPAAGEPVAPGSEIKLVLKASGSEVPKLVGLPWTKAKKLLEEAGFAVGKVREQFDEQRDPWLVLAQQPEAGARLVPGSAIDLVRNEGE